MGRQILRLVVLLMLIHMALGMVCYVCETRSVKQEEKDKTAEVVVEGAAVSGAPAPSNDGKKLGGHDIEGEGRARVTIPSCDKDKKKWDQEECDRNYPACYTLIGTVAERDEVANVLVDVKRRGCFSADLGGIFKNSSYKQDYESKGESKKDTVTSTQGGLTGKAELTVCDNLNSEKMLCNQGTRIRMENGIFNVFLVSASIFLLHFQLGRII